MRFPSLRKKETPVGPANPPVPGPEKKKLFSFLVRKSPAGMTPCPKCRTPNPSGVNFCKECGSPYLRKDVASQEKKVPGIEEPRAWLERGNEYYRKGKFAEAVDCYTAALDMNPEYTKAWNNKALALEKLGKSGEARACREKFSGLAGRGR